MARHIKRDGVAPDESIEPTNAPIPTVVGGTSGAPPDPNPRSHIIHGIHDVMPAPVSPDAEERSKERKQYRVVDCPDQIMYEGQRMVMRRGKVYTEGCIDLDFLRNQGVVFQEIAVNAA